LRKICVLLPLAFLLCCATARPQNLSSLPDAPQPEWPASDESALLAAQNQTQPAHPDPGSASPIANAPPEKRKWAQFVDPGERVVPLYPRDKWVFWLHEETTWYSLGPAFISAGYGQLTNTPAYGSDRGAFGERLAAAVFRQATMRFFANSAFPVFTHEDPRYYRDAAGNYFARGAWAAERTFVIQNDDGSHGFNFSNIFGHLAASALTAAYYPAKNRNLHNVMQTWGTSIAGSAGTNLVLEFSPDFFNALRQKKTSQNQTSSGTN
jgi:hypothetical protein